MYRLLIVDDPESCAALQSRIDWQSYGFRVVATANSHAEGISLALDLHPHMMLLGIKRGCELAEQLRAAGVRAAFAVMSDQREPEHIIRAMRAGARDFLTKPLDENELRAFLERVIVNDLGGSLSREDDGRWDVDPVLHVPYDTLPRITNKIILIVRTDCRQSLTLTGIAESLHMSSKYIGRIFLKDTGIKFSEYLMAYRMIEARKLITGTREKISVIAGMVGYGQLNNFYIHFRSYFGVSPSALREFGSGENA